MTDEIETQDNLGEANTEVVSAASSDVTVDVTEHAVVVADVRDGVIAPSGANEDSVAVDLTDSAEVSGAAEMTASDAEQETEGTADEEPRPLIGGDGPTLEAALEALLMVSDQPTAAVEFATLLSVPTDDVEAALTALAEQYVNDQRGFELRMVDGGWRYFSAGQCSEVIAKFATDGRSAKLTQAALETLAVVAYKQPVSRARIGAIRGVNVDGVMRTLMTRGLVCELDHDPATGAVLYGTTGFFLERMGLTSLNDLPPIEDHLPDLAVLDELVEPNV